MLFQRELKSYNRAHKQKTKPESKRQDVVSIIKDFHLTPNSYLLCKVISEPSLHKEAVLKLER